MTTQVQTIKTNNEDPIFNIPVEVAATAKVREIFVKGDLAGVLKDGAIAGEDGVYATTLGILVEVGVDGIAGTCATGDKVYVTTTNDLTLTKGTNRQIGVATRAKVTAASRLWVLILPSLGMAAAA